MARQQARSASRLTPTSLAVGLIWLKILIILPLLGLVLHANVVSADPHHSSRQVQYANPRNYLRSVRSSRGVTGTFGDESTAYYTEEEQEVRPNFQKLSVDSENVILPKFGDRISPRNKAAVTVVVNHGDHQVNSNNNNNLSSAKNYDNSNGNTISGNRAVVISSKNSSPNSDSVRANISGVSGATTATSSNINNLVNSNESNSSGNNSRRTNKVASTVTSTIAADREVLIPKLILNESNLKTNEVDSPILLSETQVNNQNNVSSAQAHRLEMSTEFFVVPSASTPLPLMITKSTTRRPLNGGMLILASKENRKGTQAPNSNKIVTPPTIVSSHPSGLRKEPWVVPVLVLASLAMLMMAAFEVFVLCKAWRTSPSRRHLFLGQMLLLGLFACAGLAAILTVTPTLLSCATVRFGAGVAFALVFASLLVKCVFLISLNGGVYLPAPYQGLLLLFAVLIQIAVGSQWLLTSPPAVDNISTPLPSSHSIVVNPRNSSLLLQANNLNHFGGNKTLAAVTSFVNPTIPLCRTQFSELLLSLIYVVFLILFVAVLAIKSRGIRDNYREATYIGLAIGGSIPIWLGWTLCGLAVAERHRDACLAFGLIATSTTVFLVMFMPKGRQLAAMGKEGLYVEDREERFSSLSRAGSGYSPSFFHFKPIKYGVMGGHSPSNTNTGLGLMSNNLNNNSGGHNNHTISNNNNINCGSNNNSNSSNNNHLLTGGSTTKHQAVATLGGDRVALVAATPSYSRMYHYYPAHLTHPMCYYPNPPYLTPPLLPPPPHLQPYSNSFLPPPSKPPFYKSHYHQHNHHHHHQLHKTHPTSARYPGLFMRPDDANLYTTLEPTLSSNPNVYFQRGGNVHPGMMY